MSTSWVTCHLLGPVSVTCDGRDVALPRACIALLAHLALADHAPVARDRLLLLMGDTTEPVARRRLNTVVWRIRRALEPDAVARDTVVVSTGHGLAVSPDCQLWVDATEFTTAYDRLRTLSSWSDAHAAELTRVLALYRGSFLDGLYDEWTLAERGRLADLHLSALLRLTRWHQGKGNVEQALRHAQVAVSVEPLREDLHRLAIELYHAAGLPEMARRQYDRCRTMLREQLGVEPLPETVRAVHAPAVVIGHPESAEQERRAGLIQELERCRQELRRIEDRMERSVRALSQLEPESPSRPSP